MYRIDAMTFTWNSNFFAVKMGELIKSEKGKFDLKKLHPFFKDEKNLNIKYFLKLRSGLFFPSFTIPSIKKLEIHEINDLQFNASKYIAGFFETDPKGNFGLLLVDT